MPLTNDYQSLASADTLRCSVAAVVKDRGLRAEGPFTADPVYHVSSVLDSAFSFFPSYCRSISLYPWFPTEQVIPFYNRILHKLRISLHVTADPQTRRPPHHRCSPLRFSLPAPTATTFSLPSQCLDPSSRTHCKAATQLIPLQCARRSSDCNTTAHQGSRHRLSTNIRRYRF